MLDSASEGELDNQSNAADDVEMDAIDSAREEENNATAKENARGRQAEKVTKPKAITKQRVNGTTARTAKGGKAAAPSKKAAIAGKKASRQALKEQENEERHESDTEEVDELEEKAAGADAEAGSADELSTPTRPVEAKKRPGRPTKAKAAVEPPADPPKVTASKRTAAAAASTYDLPAEVPETAKPAKRAARGAAAIRAAKAAPAPSQPNAAPRRTAQHVDELAIAETQPETMDVDAAEADDGDVLETLHTARTSAPARATSVSRRQNTLPARRRGNSASDTENNGGGASDATLRRKLGEATRALSALDIKYRSLRDVGIKEAEANFANLKRQADLKTEAADKLIASLRAELDTQTALAQESRSREQQLKERGAEVAALRGAKTELSQKLEEAKSENRTLSAKLASTRSQSAQPPSSSAVKGSGHAGAGNAQMAQLKEELYSDLTGLILRDVKREKEADVFDCIQTGRNGSMSLPVSGVVCVLIANVIPAFRFRLAISSPSPHSSSTTRPPPSYEETEFVFTPRFDGRNDQALQRLLPDYLQEEITFARGNAGKFYGRVVEVLTRAHAKDT